MGISNPSIEMSALKGLKTYLCVLCQNYLPLKTNNITISHFLFLKKNIKIKNEKDHLGFFDSTGATTIINIT